MGCVPSNSELNKQTNNPTKPSSLKLLWSGILLQELKKYGIHPKSILVNQWVYWVSYERTSAESHTGAREQG